MENKKKKTTSNTKKTPAKTTKPAVKKTTTKRKANPKKKKSVAFTLIELLAVIIILGIIMIIAVPSVTKYVSNSRKDAYIDSAKNIVGSARTLVNGGDLELYDPNVTYYIPISCIKTENTARSPYGDFTKAYVVVTYETHGYNYYWTSTDTTNTGIKDLVSFDKLDKKLIKPNVSDSDIRTDIGIDNRDNIIVFNDDCSTKDLQASAVNYDPQTGTVGEKKHMFTLNGQQYQYDAGMTWGQWVNSQYNGINAQYQPQLDIIYTQSNGWACNWIIKLDNFYVISYNDTPVKSSDVINSTFNYKNDWDSCTYRYETSQYTRCDFGEESMC